MVSQIKREIARSAGIMAIGTFLSRILGFVREILMAYYFGTGTASQAFVVAFRIPNMLRDVAGEGSANAAIVPVLSDVLVHKTREDFWHLSRRLFNISLLILVVISVAGILFSGLIIRIIAPGFIENPTKLALTIKLTRILFPSILLVGLAAYAMGILFTLRYFTAPSFGPCVLNLTFIFSILISAQVMQQPIIGVAIGILIGEVLQLAIQVPSLVKRGFKLNPQEFSLKPEIPPEVKKMGKLLGPRVFGTAIYQANIFLDTCLASLANIVGEGAVAAIYFANRLIQLPFAIVAVTFANASLPTMSTQVAQKDFASLKNTLSFSLKSVFLIMLPASIGLAVLSDEIVRILFQRGHFDVYSTQITSSALLFYALGITFYAGAKILVNCFYAMKNTITPVKIAGFCLLVNLVLNVILMFPMKVGGLALASSVSALVNFSVLLRILHKQFNFNFRNWANYAIRLLGSGLVMFLALFFFKIKLANFVSSEILRLIILLMTGIISYSLASLIFEIQEIKSIFRWILSRKVKA